MNVVEREISLPFLIQAYNLGYKKGILNGEDIHHLREVGVAMSLNIATRYYAKHQVEQLNTASYDVVAIVSYGLIQLAKRDLGHALDLLKEEGGILNSFRKGWEYVLSCMKLIMLGQSTPREVEAYQLTISKLSWEPGYDWSGETDFQDYVLANEQIALVIKFQAWAKNFFAFRDPFSDNMTEEDFDQNDNHLLSDKIKTNLLGSLIHDNPGFSLNVKELTEVLMKLLDNEPYCMNRLDQQKKEMLAKIPEVYHNLYRDYASEMDFHLKELKKFAKKIQNNKKVEINPDSELLGAFWIKYF